MDVPSRVVATVVLVLCCASAGREAVAAPKVLRPKHASVAITIDSAQDWTAGVTTLDYFSSGSEEVDNIYVGPTDRPLLVSYTLRPAGFSCYGWFGELGQATREEVGRTESAEGVTTTYRGRSAFRRMNPAGWPAQVGTLMANSGASGSPGTTYVTCVPARDGMLLVAVHKPYGDTREHMDGVRAVFAAFGVDASPPAFRSGYQYLPFRAFGRVAAHLIVTRPDDAALGTGVGWRVGWDIAMPLRRGAVFPLLGAGLAAGTVKTSRFTFEAHASAGGGVHVGAFAIGLLGTVGASRLGPGDSDWGVDTYLGVEGLARVPLGRVRLDAAVMWSAHQQRAWASLGGRRKMTLGLGVEYIRYDSSQHFAGELYGLYVGAQMP